MSARAKSKSVATAPSQPTFADFSHDAMNTTANAAVGFGFIGTMIACVGELSATNPLLAKRLAEVAGYWAGSLESEMMRFQDQIEKAWEEGGAA